MNYLGSTNSSDKDDDFVRVQDQGSQEMFGQGSIGFAAEGGEQDEAAQAAHRHDACQENADVFEVNPRDEIKAGDKDNERNVEQYRAFDSMVSFGGDSEEEDDDAQHSAIDGEGDETQCWQFLTSQFYTPGKITLDEDEFKKSVKYTLNKLNDAQQQEEGKKGLNTNIGKHYQVFLEGWKAGPKIMKIEHEVTNKETNKDELKQFIFGSQEESLAVIDWYADAPDKKDIMDWHFGLQLSSQLRLGDRYSNSRRNHLVPSVISKFDDGGEAQGPQAERSNLKDTDMEVVRLLDDQKHPDYFVIISGIEVSSNKQLIDIHKLTLPNKANILEGTETKFNFIRRINLSNQEGKVKPLQCFTTHARTWIQHTHFIYYWRIEHESDKINYQVYKYNLRSNEEEKVSYMHFEQKLEGEDTEHHEIPTCGIFRYKSMERENINKNEHLEYKPSDEKKFLQSLTVAFPIQYYDHDWRLKILVKHMGVLNDKDGIYILNVTEKHNGLKSGQFFFFDLPKNVLNEWANEIDSSNKKFYDHKIILAIEDIENPATNYVTFLECDKDVLPRNGKEEETVSSDELEQKLLQQIQVMLLDHSMQKYLYFENKHGSAIGDKDLKDHDDDLFLEKNYNEFPKIDLGEDGIIEKFEDFYDPTSQKQKQQELITFLHETLARPANWKEENEKKDGSKNSLLFDEKDKVMNINLIYSVHQDVTIYIVLTESNTLYTVIGEDKSYVRRLIADDSCAKTSHPYMRLLNIPGTSTQAQIGYKQLSPLYDNLFVEHYLEELKQTKDSVEEKWVRQLVYFHQQEGTEKPIYKKVEDKDDEIQAFGELMQMIKRIHTENGKEIPYNRFDVLDKNSFGQCRMLELANDNRPVKPRINCQKNDLLDENGDQILAAGIYLELLDVVGNRSIPGSQDKIEDFYGNSPQIFALQEQQYNLQALAASSNVYRGRKENQYCQNFQWCHIHPTKTWAKILEYRCTWNVEKPDDNKLELIGLKVVVFVVEYKETENHFFSLFNDKNDILGTQWHYQNKSGDRLRVELKRFKETEYQFHSDITSTGYKKYYSEDALDDLNIILFESKLSKKIQTHYEYFDKTERLNILEEAVRTCMNMVPNDMELYRRRLNNWEDVHFDFFQPLEVLRGQSIANFFIKIPDVIQKEIEALGENEGQMALSLVESVCKGNFEQRNSLIAANFIRNDGEPMYDFHFNNLLNLAFKDPEILTSLKQICEHIFSIPTTRSLQRIVVSCIPEMLDVQDDMDCFTNYFVAIDAEAGDNETKQTTFTTHLKDAILPKFSDEECYADRFLSNELMQTDIRRNANKTIKDRFETKEKDAQLNIQVDHFVLNFKPYVLKMKIEDFNVKPKEKEEAKDENGNPIPGKKPKIQVGTHPIDDLVLAETLNKIVEKYDYAIDDFLAIKYLVDEQFETTKQYIKIQAFIYITFFFVPLLLQIFCFSKDSVPTATTKEYLESQEAQGQYVVYCILSCLLVVVLFLGVEFIQLIENGFLDYITDGQNQIDLMTLATFLYYFIKRFYDQVDPLMPVRGDINGAVTDEEVEGVNRIFWFAILQTVIISSSFLKIMSFLKIDPGFGLLVDSVNQCIKDCIPFSTFLCAWMGLFCIVYRILGMGLTNASDYAPTQPMNNYAMYSLQVYRNTVGDDAPPGYPYWDQQLDGNPYQSRAMQAMIWGLWLFNSFLLMLILLNFLIAILCESFDTVQNEAIQYEYKAKAGMNVDTMLLKKVMGRTQFFEAVLLTCQSSVERSSNPLDKAIETIKVSQEELKEKMIAGIKKETQKQLENIEKKMKMETNAIKSMIKKEVEGEKQELFTQVQKLVYKMNNAKHSLVNDIGGATNELIANQEQIEEDFQRNINDTRERLDEGVNNVNQNVEEENKAVEQDMTVGLGSVVSSMDKSKTEQATKSKSIQDMLEGLVKDQVSVLLGKIDDMQKENVVQQEKNHEEMENLKDQLKDQLEQIKKENQAELEKIKGELVDTLDQKTNAGVESNKNSGQQLMKDIEGIMDNMNKKIGEQNDANINKLQAQVDGKTDDLLKVVNDIKSKL